tara:strand:- start:649 stop:750 length:102 start_codon:yes stop_codon:yes gene_type:complete
MGQVGLIQRLGVEGVGFLFNGFGFVLNEAGFLF